MYNKVLKVCNYDTSKPLMPDRALIRSLMAYNFRDNHYSSENSTKSKNNHDKNSTVRHESPSHGNLKIRSKVRSMAFNSHGTRLYIATRDSVYLFNVQSMAVEHTLHLKTTTLIAHPKHPNIFALLVQGSSHSKPSVKVFDAKYTEARSYKVDLTLMCVITSAFNENWYTGCWSLDGKYMALVDREDTLQVVEFGNSYKDMQLKENSSVKLDSEAYGIIYTKDYLVIHRVDGHLQIFSLDLNDSFVERAHSHIVTASAFDSNRNLLATGGSDHVVNLFDVDSRMVCITTFPRLEGQVSSLSFSSNGALLAWGTKDSAPCPIDDLSVIDSTLESSTSSSKETEDKPPQYYLTIAGVDPSEIYYQHNTPSPVAHVAFSPNKPLLAYACDYDSFPRGGKSSSHGNLVGFLHLPF
ncbi:WD domain G-beta repeat protein [Theileria parva strain Muguga]|uniref:Uncharacterized protein n=1 Tax=Theileria parva TaxID=5875 RepID=Q4N1Q9_THEPA|nr:WD domain G-beta repeat protein [Theileria parva strain Muguga]EAN32023.1 WD domain G-beta repeat protein [Theileria parva strain Muguga]|eukprot:XP_764306.1 hypothetical protein [Theileria parva strain Muguga]